MLYINIMDEFKMLICRFFKVIFSSLFILLVFGISNFSTSHASIIGSCDGYFDDPHAVGEILPSGEVIRAMPLPILRKRANVYDKPHNEEGIKISELTFGHEVFLKEYRDGYFHVSNDTREDIFLGWVHGNDILCKYRPLLNKQGVEKKFIPNGASILLDENMDAIILQSDPNSSACKLKNGRCQVLKRSLIYSIFAYDEVARKVLIKSGLDSALLGWVNIDNGYIWDTRHGLMPRYFGGAKKTICFNKTLEDASSRKCLRSITGGNEWYSYTYRIPVLDRVNYNGRYYFQVVAHFRNTSNSTSKDKLLNDDQPLNEIPLMQEGYIEDNNHVQLEVLVHGEEFRNWRSKLELVKDTSLLSRNELRETIVKMLQNGLYDPAKILTPDVMNMSIADIFIQKHGLPTSSKSPLLNYTMGNFINQDENSKNFIEICELYRVGRWLERHREIFDAIDRSEEPLFKLEKTKNCNMMYNSPELIIEGRQPFPEDIMSFRKVMNNETVYWIPDNFLP